MVTITGFSAFQYYNAVKSHLRNGKFNILKDKIPSYYKKQWERCNQKKLYYSVDRSVERNKKYFYRIFAYYWLRNKDYHISDILKDKFKLFKKLEFELDNIEDIVERDFIYILAFIDKKNKKLKDVLFSINKLPVVIQMYFAGKISIFSLLVFDNVFNIYKNIDRKKLRKEDKEKYKTVKIIFDKFLLLFYTDIVNRDWKTIIRNCL